jgi:hypothetical protein
VITSCFYVRLLSSLVLSLILFSINYFFMSHALLFLCLQLSCVIQFRIFSFPLSSLSTYPSRYHNSIFQIVYYVRIDFGHSDTIIISMSSFAAPCVLTVFSLVVVTPARALYPFPISRNQRCMWPKAAEESQPSLLAN